MYASYAAALKADPFPLLKLPNDLIVRVFNDSSLRSPDRANGRFACTHLRDIVQFRDIGLKGGSTLKSHMASALASARGLCETINMHAECYGMDPREIVKVGEAHPELVARLRAVHIVNCPYDAILKLLSRALFPALEALILQTGCCGEPPIDIVSDPRVTYDWIHLRGDVTGVCERIANPPGCISIEYYPDKQESLRMDVERALNAGLRVDHLFITHFRDAGNSAVWDRFCAAVVPIATSNICISNPCSAAVMHHISADINDIRLSMSPGLFSAIEARFMPGAGIHMHIKTCNDYDDDDVQEDDVQEDDVQEDDVPEEDVAALERLLAAGTIKSLDWTAGTFMKAMTWTRMFRASPTAIRDVIMGSLTLDNAITVFAHAPTLATHIRFTLAEAYSMHQYCENQYSLQQYTLLATLLSDARHLRELYISHEVIYFPDKLTFETFVRTITNITLSVKHVKFQYEHSTRMMWSRKRGFMYGNDITQFEYPRA